VVDAFHAALRRGDTTAASALLSDDVLIFEAGGAERSKAEYMAEHLSADAEFARATTVKVEWRSGRAAGPTAWITSAGRTAGEFRGHPINSRTTETMVLTRTRGRWKIQHIHWSSAPVR
jgi:ketosteroid isomerase-like protein